MYNRSKVMQYNSVLPVEILTITHYIVLVRVFDINCLIIKMKMERLLDFLFSQTMSTLHCCEIGETMSGHLHGLHVSRDDEAPVLPPFVAFLNINLEHMTLTQQR